VDDENRAWFCPYTDFFLASVLDDHVEYVLPRAPTFSANALTVGASFFAFIGGIHQSSMIAMVDRESLRLRLIQLHGGDGGTLSSGCVATRGAQAVAIANAWLYRLDQNILLDALGPWTDDNTSTVASAVQYFDEESSYSNSYMIYGAGPKVIPGIPRPAENQPRNDKHTHTSQQE
jgi:hypothetical protein